MNELWNDFRKWVRYVREYKDNIEYLDIKEGEAIEYNRQISILNKQLAEYGRMYKELETICRLKDERNNIIRKKLRDAKRKINELKSETKEGK